MQTLIPSIETSALALHVLRLEPDAAFTIADTDCDTLLYAFAGSGSLVLEGNTSTLDRESAALVLAGEDATLAGGGEGLEVILAAVGSEADRHAPLGQRETVVRMEGADSNGATGGRAFQVLFGPQNGSTRATLFAGFVPPGKAPWHYHLYDEIVWLPQGPGRLHLGGTTTDLGPGSAFRLRPREVHIVENTAPNVMTLIGVFTPAGSPSAAYLTPDVAAAYRFAG